MTQHRMLQGNNADGGGEAQGTQWNGFQGTPQLRPTDASPALLRATPEVSQQASGGAGNRPQPSLRKASVDTPFPLALAAWTARLLWSHGPTSMAGRGSFLVA